MSSEIEKEGFKTKMRFGFDFTNISIPKIYIPVKDSIFKKKKILPCAIFIYLYLPSEEALKVEK
ncbi:hypothetical protein MSG28_015715, partial [Choristoneura fumiferana]